MLKPMSKMVVADNSGARDLKCIRVLGSSNKRYAHVGDIVVGVVLRAYPNMEVKDDEIVRSVVVRTRNPIRRKDGTYVRFDDNACVIIDKDGNPRGTRVLGPVARELRDKNFMKIISLAAEVV